MTAANRPSGRALFDFSHRVKLRVRGGDRVRYLNGQLTNDIHKATSSCALEACILNAKGKMDAHVFVTAGDDSYLLDADAELRESLQLRLERYIIADDVEVEDVTDQLSIFHVLTPEPPALGAADTVAAAQRFVNTGWDLWVPSKQQAASAAELARKFPLCDSDCAEILRIEHGIPRWGRELTAQIIPIEANLEARCIDYEKGCYIGQETISRMKMSGQQSKKLCGLVSAAPLSSAMRLYPPEDSAKEVGWITSAVVSRSLGKNIGLGYIKRGFNSSGIMLRAGSAAKAAEQIAVQVVDLPFR